MPPRHRPHVRPHTGRPGAQLGTSREAIGPRPQLTFPRSPGPVAQDADVRLLRAWRPQNSRPTHANTQVSQMNSRRGVAGAPCVTRDAAATGLVCCAIGRLVLSTGYRLRGAKCGVLEMLLFEVCSRCSYMWPWYDMYATLGILYCEMLPLNSLLSLRSLPCLSFFHRSAVDCRYSKPKFKPTSRSAMVSA